MTLDFDGPKKALLDILNMAMLAETITFDTLDQKARETAQIFTPTLTRSEIDEVIVRITELGSVELRLGAGVVDQETFKPWLAARKNEVSPKRWAAYKTLLIQREWSPNVVAKLDTQTDTLVELMGDPQQQGDWRRRGLAIGEVQSGKTATYVGVLNKAIDYGYKIIIVIGGHTEDLRRQTQRRLDSDLAGVDSAYFSDNIDQSAGQMPIGVGEVDSTIQSHQLTSVTSDFSAKSKRAGRVVLTAETPSVFVVKKNAKVLENLTAYLIGQTQGHQKLNAPLIVVDDEADWASVNTKSESDVAAVNKAIRKLLATSNRNSYLGITATPFANILIDDEIEEDLFPRDYIQALESPSNYGGVESYFGTSIQDHASPGRIKTDVSDCLDVLPFNHKRNATVSQLPDSMKRAISTFFVGTAIRRLRDKSPKPSSMMVNVSRFNDVQAQVADLVDDYVGELNRATQAEFGLDEDAFSVSSDETISLRDAFDAEFAKLADWSDVRLELLFLTEGVRTELVNSATTAARNRRRSEMSRDDRMADSLLPTIYVGGDVLARGLTLDGLIVSYFVRKAGAADTLLQMGRWFGYRPNYEDLVRVWMDSVVVDLFRYVAEVSDDLRGSLREMNALQATPRLFGLKMRRHPESFLITAANKQKNATEIEGEVIIHGSTFESYALSMDPIDRDRNLNAVQFLAQEISDLGEPSGRATNHNVWEEVPSEKIHRLFAHFRGHDSELFFGSRTTGIKRAQIAAYLSEAVNSDTWDVAFVSGAGEDVKLAPNITLKSSIRNKLIPSGEGTRVQLGNRRVAAGNDLKNALPKSTLTELQKGLRDGDRLTEPILLHRGLERPLLLVFTITTTADSTPPPEVEILPENPLAALVVAFPSMSNEEELETLKTKKKSTRFVANTVYAREQFGLPMSDDDVESEDYE